MKPPLVLTKLFAGFGNGELGIGNPIAPNPPRDPEFPIAPIALSHPLPPSKTNGEAYKHDSEQAYSCITPTGMTSKQHPQRQ